MDTNRTIRFKTMYSHVLCCSIVLLIINALMSITCYVSENIYVTIRELKHSINSNIGTIICWSLGAFDPPTYDDISPHTIPRSYDMLTCFDFMLLLASLKDVL